MVGKWLNLIEAYRLTQVIIDQLFMLLYNGQTISQNLTSGCVADEKISLEIV